LILFVPAFFTFILFSIYSGGVTALPSNQIEYIRSDVACTVTENSLFISGGNHPEDPYSRKVEKLDLQ
jgi:hypothetical protein